MENVVVTRLLCTNPFCDLKAATMEAVRFVLDMALDAEEELTCVEVTASCSTARLMFCSLSAPETGSRK